TAFVANAKRFSPFPGWIHRPGTRLRQMPSREEVEEIVASGKKFDADGLTPEYCYWFLKKVGKEQREILGGLGGMITLLLKPDPNTVPPKLAFPEGLLKSFGSLLPIKELDGLLESAAAMKDGFLAKSKQVFGKELANQPQFKAIPFVLPLLSAADFFTHAAE